MSFGSHAIKKNLFSVDLDGYASYDGAAQKLGVLLRREAMVRWL